MNHVAILTSIGGLEIAEVLTAQPFIPAIVGIAYFLYATILYFEGGSPPDSGMPIAA
jgi:hypothetical protein